MPAFHATWTAFFLLFAQESTEWATGKAFESAARRDSVSVFWEQAPLRSQLQALSRSQRVAILLDRRIDPGQKIDWQSRDLSLEQFLWDLGEQQELGVTQIGSLLYFGPRESALALAEQNRLWTQRVDDPAVPAALRKRLNESVRWSTAEPLEPSAWLARDAAAANLELLNPEQLPYDLWGPFDWPRMPRYQAYLLMLAGFGQGLDLESDALRLAPLDLPAQLSCEFPLDGLEQATIEKLSQEFPDLTLTVASKILTAVGPPKAQSKLQRQLALLRRPPKEADGKRVFTLKTNAPRGAILATIAQQLGVKLEFADELRPLLNERIELDVQRVSVEQLLSETLRDTGLTHRLEKGVLQLQAK